MNSKDDIDLAITGHLKWDELRDLIIQQLKEATTEERFIGIIKALIFASSSSEEEMQKKRRSLGLSET